MFLSIFYLLSMYGFLVGMNRLNMSHEHGNLTKSKRLFWNQFNPFILLVMKRLRRSVERDKLVALENDIFKRRRVIVEKTTYRPTAKECKACKTIPTCHRATGKFDWMCKIFLELHCDCTKSTYGIFGLTDISPEHRPFLLEEGMGSIATSAEFEGRYRDLLIMRWNESPNMQQVESSRVITKILTELETM